MSDQKPSESLAPRAAALETAVKGLQLPSTHVDTALGLLAAKRDAASAAEKAVRAADEARKAETAKADDEKRWRDSVTQHQDAVKALEAATEPAATAIKKAADAYTDVLTAVRAYSTVFLTRLSEADPLAASISELLPVAALSESVREWFPVDPEMTPLRGTVLVPAAMTAKKKDADPAPDPDDVDLAVLVKRFLAHLSK